MADAQGIAAARLLSFIERIERLDAERQAIADDIKEVKSEAKSAGFDVKTLNALLKRRKLSKEERDEQDALLETYEHAVQQALPMGEPEGDGGTTFKKAGPEASAAAKRLAKMAAEDGATGVKLMDASGKTLWEIKAEPNGVPAAAPDLRAEYDAARDAPLAPEPIVPPKDVAGSLASIKAAMHAPSR